MPSPELTDDELERAAIASRAIATQHEKQSRRVTGQMRAHFAEQSKRYRALAERFEQSRTPARGQ